MEPLLAIADFSLLPPWQQIRSFSAELWLIGCIAAVLLTPFFVRRRVSTACALVAAAGLLLAAASTVSASTASPLILNHLLTADACADGWKLILFLFVVGVIVLHVSRRKPSVLSENAPEFYTLLLGSTLGMSLMGSASNWLTLFLAVELTSLSSYLLAGFHKTQRHGAEASLKYVLFGASITAVMAYGLSLLYGITGTLQFASLNQDISAGGSGLAIFACFTLVAGLGFKISAVPFHLWCPDVFDGAEIEVTTFLSVASKGAALILLTRAVSQLGLAATKQNAPVHATAALIGWMAALTMTVGNTAAFSQTSTKRLLAYSSIAQAGYVLAALAFPRPGTAAAVLLYLGVYAVMNLGAFAVAAGVADAAGGDGSVTAFRKLGRRSPVLAASMTLMLVSLVGLPPLAGFGAKLSILWAVVQHGGAAWALAAVFVANTAASAFYYFRIVRLMYLDEGDAATAAPARGLVLLAAGCAVLLFVGFVGFGPLSSIADRYGRLLLQP